MTRAEAIRALSQARTPAERQSLKVILFPYLYGNPAKRLTSTP